VNQLPKSLQWLVWGSVAVTITAILGTFIFTKSRERNAQLNRATAGSEGGSLRPVLFKIPDFVLTNQSGQVVTASDLRGKVWVADIIFTSCAGPCPEMTRRMAELQSAVAGKESVKFVTLTTHPEFDTPSVLELYGRRFGADFQRWHFLTGSKQQIADLAVGGLKLTAMEKEKDKQEDLNDLFIHSTLFVLVDKQGQARGVFESDEPEMKLKILEAIDQLLQEN
jgi:cytochrome oxidase Cu insertion factor (SCO1/SenC/PrrC family)